MVWFFERNGNVVDGENVYNQWEMPHVSVKKKRSKQFVAVKEMAIQWAENVYTQPLKK